MNIFCEMPGQQATSGSMRMSQHQAEFPRPRICESKQALLALQSIKTTNVQAHQPHYLFSTIEQDDQQKHAVAPVFVSV